MHAAAKLVAGLIEVDAYHKRREDFRLGDVPDDQMGHGLIEEALEVAREISSGSTQRLREELADLLGVMLHIMYVHHIKPEDVEQQCIINLQKNFEPQPQCQAIDEDTASKCERPMFHEGTHQATIVSGDSPFSAISEDLDRRMMEDEAEIDKGLDVVKQYEKLYSLARQSVRWLNRDGSIEVACLPRLSAALQRLRAEIEKPGDPKSRIASPCPKCGSQERDVSFGKISCSNCNEWIGTTKLDEDGGLDVHFPRSHSPKRCAVRHSQGWQCELAPGHEGGCKFLGIVEFEDNPAPRAKRHECEECKEITVTGADSKPVKITGANMVPKHCLKQCRVTTHIIGADGRIVCSECGHVYSHGESTDVPRQNTD